MRDLGAIRMGCGELIASLGAAADAYGMVIMGLAGLALAAFLTFCITCAVCLERHKGCRWWVAGAAASVGSSLVTGLVGLFACALIHPYAVPATGLLVAITTGYVFHRTAVAIGSDAPPDP